MADRLYRFELTSKDKDEDGVPLLKLKVKSLRASKGLEFPVVAMVGDSAVGLLGRVGAGSLLLAWR